MYFEDPMCDNCKHYWGIIFNLESGFCTEICSAFPNGIPDEIYRHYADHSKPFPGDNGIQFEPK